MKPITRTLRPMLRFRLRTLLLVVTVVSVALGMYVKNLRDRKATVEAIRERSGSVTFSWQPDYEEVVQRRYQEKLAALTGAAPPRYSTREPPGPAWLRSLFGDAAVSDVVRVELPRRRDEEFDLRRLAIFEELTHLQLHGVWTDAEVHGLEQLPGLTHLDLSYARVGAETVERISSLGRLETLNLSRTNVTDESMSRLSKLKRLRILELSGTAITDAGLRLLHNLPNLEHVVLSNTDVTPAGFAAFAAAQPKCYVPAWNTIHPIYRVTPDQPRQTDNGTAVKRGAEEETESEHVE